MASGFTYTHGNHDGTWTTAGSSNDDSSLEFRVPVYNIGGGKPYSTQVIKTASREGSHEPVSKQYHMNAPLVYGHTVPFSLSF